MILFAYTYDTNMYLISFPCYRINIPTTFNSIETDGTVGVVILTNYHQEKMTNLLWGGISSFSKIMQDITKQKHNNKTLATSCDEVMLMGVRKF